MDCNQTLIMNLCMVNAKMNNKKGNPLLINSKGKILCILNK